MNTIYQIMSKNCLRRSLRLIVLYSFCLVIQNFAMGVVHAESSSYDDFIFAVKFDDAATVKSLLQRGIDVNSVEALRGESALMVAIREKSLKVVDVLLSSPEIKLEARAQNGDTALMLASYSGNTVVVQKLITAGAEVNRPGWAAIHYAAASGNVETLNLLLDNAAYIDSESPNKTTPLMLAIWSGKYDTAKVLIDAGADIQLKNDAGMTAKDFAKEVGRNDLISLFK